MSAYKSRVAFHDFGQVLESGGYESAMEFTTTTLRRSGTDPLIMSVPALRMPLCCADK